MRQFAFDVASAQSIQNIFDSRLLLKPPYPPARHLIFPLTSCHDLSRAIWQRTPRVPVQGEIPADVRDRSSTDSEANRHHRIHAPRRTGNMPGQLYIIDITWRTINMTTLGVVGR